MSKRTTGLVLILVAGLLSGCLLHMAFPVQIPIQGTASYQAYYAKVAVDGNGTLHIVHNECEISLQESCFIFYRKVKVGGTLETRYWSPPYGGTYTYPDIAVTNDGTAYLAWQYENSSHDRYDMWTRADSSEAPWFVDSTYLSNEQPILASNGTVVFILYKVIDGTGSAYRYKRITPGDPVGGWASPHGDNVRRTHADAAVSPDNKLYIIWAVYNSGVNSIYYNDNHDSAANMVNLHTIVSGQSVSYPKIDVTEYNSTTYVYMLYNDFEPDGHVNSDDLHLVICDNEDCSSYLDHLLALPSAQLWSVGDYDLSGVGNRAYVTFTAMKDGLTRMQVFWTGYKFSPAEDYTVQQITTAEYHHTKPQLLAFVVGVADDSVMTYQRQDGSSEYDLYEYDTVNNQEQYLGASLLGNQDMAQNSSSGEVFLGGTWVASNTLEGDGRLAAFFTYNDIATFFPLIRR